MSEDFNYADALHLLRSALTDALGLTLLPTDDELVAHVARLHAESEHEPTTEAGHDRLVARLRAAQRQDDLAHRDRIAEAMAARTRFLAAQAADEQATINEGDSR
ncbi:hypothetical protein ACIGG9_16140 [Pseudonocardia alni]|uniref:hypothetical protein n=1 Tax=Pseudonocardia alni TaxID=33907 RepID=UPI0033CF3583